MENGQFGLGYFAPLWFLGARLSGPLRSSISDSIAKAAVFSPHYNTLDKKSHGWHEPCLRSGVEEWKEAHGTNTKIQYATHWEHHYELFVETRPALRH